jgi:hypothetical protein
MNSIQVSSTFLQCLKSGILLYTITPLTDYCSPVTSLPDIRGFESSHTTVGQSIRFCTITVVAETCTLKCNHMRSEDLPSQSTNIQKWRYEIYRHGLNMATEIEHFYTFFWTESAQHWVDPNGSLNLGPLTGLQAERYASGIFKADRRPENWPQEYRI